MNTNRKMSPEEIHNFGVEIVFNQLKKDGYEVESVNTKIGVDPQIIAKKDGILAFIAVRTAGYPEKGKLEKSVHFQMMENAKKFKAIPYFASDVRLFGKSGMLKHTFAAISFFVFMPVKPISISLNTRVISIPTPSSP